MPTCDARQARNRGEHSHCKGYVYHVPGFAYVGFAFR